MIIYPLIDSSAIVVGLGQNADGFISDVEVLDVNDPNKSHTPLREPTGLRDMVFFVGAIIPQNLAESATTQRMGRLGQKVRICEKKGKSFQWSFSNCPIFLGETLIFKSLKSPDLCQQVLIALIIRLRLCFEIWQIKLFCK